MKAAVVILNWNGLALLRKYLPGVVRYSEMPGVEVVVADNGSTDGSLSFLAEEFPTVRCIDLTHNHGFAEGYNLALAQVDADYAVLLNSDVEVTEGWLAQLTGYLDEHSDVAACQPKIRSLRDRSRFEHAGAAGGFMDALGYPFCRGRYLSTAEEDRGQYDTVLDLFWATGACLCIRLDDYRAVGGLDARFFAHMEEIDLCWRLRSRNRRIVCVPSAVVYHLGGATLDKENPHKTFLNYRNNLLMLYKNCNPGRWAVVSFCRFFLDYFALLVFLLTRKPGDAGAVWRARMAFRRMKHKCRVQRRENLEAATLKRIPEMYRGSLLFGCYFQGKKQFADFFPETGK